MPSTYCSQSLTYSYHLFPLSTSYSPITYPSTSLKPPPSPSPPPLNLLHFLPLLQHLQLLILPFLLQNLPDGDGLWDKTDAYIRVKVAGQEEQKTPAINGELNPIYTKDNTFIFRGGVGTVVELAAMDWDPVSSDDLLVRVIFIHLFMTKFIIFFRPVSPSPKTNSQEKRSLQG